MEREEQPKSLGELKLLILNRVMDRLFLVVEYLDAYDGDHALRTLWNTYCLLPPDVAKDCHDGEKELTDLLTLVASIRNPDRFMRVKEQTMALATRCDEMRKIVSKISGLMYQRYLREGFTGLDINVGNEESKYSLKEEDE